MQLINEVFRSPNHKMPVGLRLCLVVLFQKTKCCLQSQREILFFILFWDSEIWTRRLQLIKGSSTIFNESKQPKQLIGPRRKFSNLVSHCNLPLCNCRLQWHILVKQCYIHQVGWLLQCQTSDIFLQLHRFWLLKCVHELKKKIFFLKK